MYDKIRRLYLYMLALPKTIYFNFRYLKFRDAIKFPIIVSHRVWLMLTDGDVTIHSSQIKTGMIKIGFGKVGIFDQHRSRSIWQVSGNVIFNGVCCLGHGSKISVSNLGTLELGNNFNITAESSIVCQERIVIGDDCIISWDTLIMDTDFHKIESLDGTILNEDKPVIIGNKVWIGCRCLILKGTNIPNGFVIAANSTLTKSFSGENRIIGGNPGRVIKEDVIWQP